MLAIKQNRQGRPYRRVKKPMERVVDWNGCRCVVTHHSLTKKGVNNKKRGGPKRAVSTHRTVLVTGPWALKRANKERVRGAGVHVKKILLPRV